MYEISHGAYASGILNLAATMSSIEQEEDDISLTRHDIPFHYASFLIIFHLFGVRMNQFDVLKRKLDMATERHASLHSHCPILHH